MAETTVISTTFKLRRGTAEVWKTKNPILAQGEPGFEYDTGRLKIGNGILPYVDLDYVGEGNIFFSENGKDFPAIGQFNRLYVNKAESKIYHWVEDKYVPFTTGVEDLDISNISQAEGDYIILYGGSATDNI